MQTTAVGRAVSQIFCSAHSGSLSGRRAGKVSAWQLYQHLIFDIRRAQCQLSITECKHEIGPPTVACLFGTTFFDKRDSVQVSSEQEFLDKVSQHEGMGHTPILVAFTLIVALPSHATISASSANASTLCRPCHCGLDGQVVQKVHLLEAQAGKDDSRGVSRVSFHGLSTLESQIPVQSWLLTHMCFACSLSLVFIDVNSVPGNLVYGHGIKVPCLPHSWSNLTRRHWCGSSNAARS